MPSAAILNGGRAVRYGGADKGALPVGGRTIRDRQLGMLAAMSDDIMLVGGTAPPNDVTATPEHGPAVRWIADHHPGQGPLAGIEAALSAAHHDLTIVLACDMPAVSPALLALLLAHATGQAAGDAGAGSPEDQEVDVVVPRTARGYHPLCAIYRRDTCLPVVRAHLAAGRLAVRDMLPALRVRELNETDLAAVGDAQWLLANVNTPAEHDALVTSIAHKAHEL